MLGEQEWGAFQHEGRTSQTDRLTGSERERERQTDRQREREKESLDDNTCT